MTPRERIIATIRHQVPDRIPTEGWFHSEVQNKLKAHYQTHDWNVVLEKLGIEGWVDLSPWVAFPEFERRSTPRPNGKSGPKAIWLDDRTYENGWGVRHRIGESGWYEEWISGPLVNAEDPKDVEKHPFPSLDQILEPNEYRKTVASLKAQGHFVSGCIDNPYKTAWLLRGMENLLADYLINRELVEALYDRLYPICGELAKRMARAGVDEIRIAGDIAMQDRIVMGPDLWRAVDKPRLAKLIADCRSINPDAIFFIHSDGNVTDLMNDIIEIGFNVVNPIQPECMDPAEVKKRWGSQITIHGGISLQRTLPFGSPADVRKEVEDLIRSCGYNGGLIAFPSNVIQPDTSIENVIACFHAARDFDLRKM